MYVLFSILIFIHVILKLIESLRRFFVYWVAWKKGQCKPYHCILERIFHSLLACMLISQGDLVFKRITEMQWDTLSFEGKQNIKYFGYDFPFLLVSRSISRNDWSSVRRSIPHSLHILVVYKWNYWYIALRSDRYDRLVLCFLLQVNNARCECINIDFNCVVTLCSISFLFGYNVLHVRLYKTLYRR